MLLEPALRLARDGVALGAFQADTCRLLAPLYTHTDDIRRVYAPTGRLIEAEERLFIPDLADTLIALAREGEAYARNGALARALLDDQAANGGLLTATDLARYEVLRSAPITLRYRDYEVMLPGMCSVGGSLTACTLRLLAAFDVAALPHGSAAHLRLLAEVMAATTRARIEWDDLLETLPEDEATRRFLDEAQIARYREELRDTLAGRRPSALVTERPGPSNTSHLSVIDADGLAVGLTTTAGESAGYIVPGTGYIPNNMLGEEDLHPKGFHSRPAGQRIPTMMTPVVVLAGGRPRLGGGNGGRTPLPSGLLQHLLRRGA